MNHKKYLITFFMIMGFFGLAGKSEGADFYVTQNAVGSDTGSDCDNAHSVAWFNTVENWGNPKVLGKIGPGDTVHLCGVISTNLTIHTSGSNENPISILFENNAKLSAPTWTANTGIITTSNNNYIIIDGGVNGVIEATDNGTTAANGGVHLYNNEIYGVYINSGSHVTIKNLTIQNMYDRLQGSTDCVDTIYPASIHTLGSINNIIIEGNHLLNAYRNIQLGANGNYGNIHIRNNYMTEAEVQINGGASPGQIADGIYIYNNTLIEGGIHWIGICRQIPYTFFHTDGIHLFTPIVSGSYGIVKNVLIYNNYIQDFEGTAGVYLEYPGLSNAIVYNNILRYTGGKYPSNGAVSVKGADNVKIYNNTFISDTGAQLGSAILLNDVYTYYTLNTDIKNNIFNMPGVLTTTTLNATWTSDYNCFNNLVENSILIALSTFHNIGWWLSQGYDAHGMISNPQLDSNYKPTSTSPCIDAGINLSTYFTTDKIGISRPQGSAWDIGAFEYVSETPDTTPPAAPVGLTVN